jgi:hypothetical protein
MTIPHHVTAAFRRTPEEPHVTVFISHSGDRSKTVAEKIGWLVRMVMPATDPWISTGIEKGSRWEAEIAQNLEATDVGIVALQGPTCEPADDGTSPGTWG